MSLLNPHLGELLDRYCVLTMKMQAKPDDKMFLEEWAAVEKEIRQKPLAHVGEVMLLAAGLGAINGRIWELVAQAHAGQEVSSVELQRLNEARARVIRRLGELAGATELDKKVF